MGEAFMMWIYQNDDIRNEVQGYDYVLFRDLTNGFNPTAIKFWLCLATSIKVYKYNNIDESEQQWQKNIKN